MVVTGVSMVVTALLVLIAIEATLGSGHSNPGSASGNPEVSAADHLQAQQSLSTALQAVNAASAGGAGGVPGLGASGSGSGTGAGSGVTVAELSASDPSLTFVAGPSTTATTVSVASEGGSVTLATRSSDGVCWLVWHAPGSADWYGAQTHAGSCSAPGLSSPPSPGPVSSNAIGWQSGSFPPV